MRGIPGRRGKRGKTKTKLNHSLPNKKQITGDLKIRVTTISASYQTY